MRDIGLNADVRVLFGQPTLASLAAASGKTTDVQVPATVISADCRLITPDMLPLARLTQAQIDRVVATVPGGVSNVQDIYGLVPLQEGILYHHLSSEEGDPYLLQALLRVNSFEQLLDFTEALQQVIDRHDILRTAVAWEELDEPVQVVWRQARLRVEAFLPHPEQGDVAAQLQAQFDPRRIRMDLHQAPMMRLHYAEDPVNQSWVAVLLFHHLIDDATSLALLGAEIEAFRQGRGDHLPASVPYRNHVAQARLSMSREEHEAFFRDMLADVDEPTLPFGLQDVQGDGSGVDEALLPVDPELAECLRPCPAPRRQQCQPASPCVGSGDRAPVRASGCGLRYCADGPPAQWSRCRAGLGHVYQYLAIARRCRRAGYRGCSAHHPRTVGGAGQS